MKKQLSQILPSIEYTLVQQNGFTPCEPDTNIEITNLAFDSRDVTLNTLFFALPGTHTTGNRFINKAIENGAKAIVFQDEFSDSDKNAINSAITKSGTCPVFIKVTSARYAMSPLSTAFYDNPSKKLVIYGVTGTEGKSSTVSFIWQLLKLSGIKAGFISTVQYSLGDDAIDNPQHQTTPEAPIIQRQLYEMLENGCTHAVVESSSHGLSTKTNRLGNVLFDAALFMNVTLEHLEFHGTYDQYKSDKANLFRALNHDHIKIIAGKEQKIPAIGIVNAEDPAASYFAECTNENVIAFTTLGKAGKSSALPEPPAKLDLYTAENIESSSNSISFTISGKEKTTVTSPIPGAFNAYNIMAAILAVHNTTGITLQNLSESAKKLTTVKGRMTQINKGQPFEVIVDYAHTPSSFETIFPPIKARAKGKIISVFGSGGERDTTKRPLQGQIAAKYCDYIILTDEDPRKEGSMPIIEQIAEGAKNAGAKENVNLFLIPDRPKAIRYAFSLAKKDDIVLLLGKSHENSIIYADYTMKYDEIQEAEKALMELTALA